ncbi:MAG: hypothetical protein LQ348_000172 [Seirophora lacunosa]|nr:MAG: hypothetical protein LQ348_000172 [Seirophora lacunosa]
MAGVADPTKSIAFSPPASLLEADERSNQDDYPSLLSDLDSASITASVLDYEFENGRRYHAYKAGSYPLPNDEPELERIDIKHHVTLLLSAGNLHLAPLVNPKRILDIGTGTGIWAIEMAEQYPQAQVIGTDLSPVQPQWYEKTLLFHLRRLSASSAAMEAFG